jgi:hypothetical protein
MANKESVYATHWMSRPKYKQKIEIARQRGGILMQEVSASPKLASFLSAPEIYRFKLALVTGYRRHPQCMTNVKR